METRGILGCGAFDVWLMSTEKDCKNCRVHQIYSAVQEKPIGVSTFFSIIPYMTPI